MHQHLRQSRPTTSFIDLSNLSFNYGSARSFIGHECEVMAVVKADAYGHGAVECARTLEADGVDWFAVALPEEGVELRKAGIALPILCLGGFWPGQESTIIDNAITPVIADLDRAARLQSEAGRRGVSVAYHVKVDTGMGRIGILPSEVPSFSRALMTFPDLRLEGVMSHLAVADDLGQTEFTASQIEALDSATDAFREAGHGPIYIDIANSPGAVAHPSARKKIVRLGGILYGLGGDVLPKQAPAPELRPVMSLRTKISGIKDFPAGAPLGYGKTYVTDRPSKIATIPIGYHDGLPRVLSNRGTVLVRGRRAPIRGRISMDWTIIDVTEIPGVELYDDVTVIGADLDERILAEDLAIEAGTISYEITCGIGARVPRSYDSGE